MESSVGLSLQGSVVIGGSWLFAMAERPTIRNSLVAGEFIFLGENTNTTTLNPAQLVLIAKLGTALSSADKKQIQVLLAGLDRQVEPYDSMAYVARGEEYERYKKKFGELAGIASIFDIRYMNLLTGSESTDVNVDNSLIIGSTARILGGKIANSVIASERWLLNGAHVKLKNTFLVTVDRNVSPFYVEDGRIGSPDLAKAAVEVVKDLPPSPLLTM